jgi:hypothetical protein
MNTGVTRREAINVLIDGAMKVCDHADDMWLSSKADNRQEHMKRWKNIRERCRELIRELRSNKDS